MLWQKKYGGKYINFLLDRNNESDYTWSQLKKPNANRAYNGVSRPSVCSVSVYGIYLTIQECGDAFGRGG